MPATAADIPIELYDLILSFFTLEHLFFLEDERHQVHVSKRELGYISLVCHDWAVACRSMLFARISLRNKERVEALLHLMTQPGSRIAGYIENIWCNQFLSSPSTPWMHVVRLQLLPRLPSSPTMSMDLRGPLHPGQRLTSVVFSSPRHLPSRSLRIESLTLEKVHFEQFRDVMRMIGEIPSLSMIRCTEATWNVSPDDQLPMPISFLSGNSRDSYFFDECTDNAAAVWLHWLLPPIKACRMREEDGHALCRIASAFVKSIDAPSPGQYPAATSRTGNTLDFCIYGTHSSTSAQVHLTSAHSSEWISSLELDFDPDLVPRPSYPNNLSIIDIIAHVDWTTIDEQLATLRDLDTVSLRFNNFGNLLLFARDVVAWKMPRLNGSTKLTYGVENRAVLEKQWIWYTPETIQLELAKEAEKRSKELEAAEGTDGSSAELNATERAVEDVDNTKDEENTDVVTLGVDENLAAVEAYAGL